MHCAASAVDRSHRVDVAALRARIALDRNAGLEAVSRGRLGRNGGYRRHRRSAGAGALCREQGLWFHVDGAYGALGILSPALAPRLAGIENADSIALDFHKWGQVPYDAGFLMVRDGRNTATRLPRRRPICAGKPGALPPARFGRAISVPICRAAFRALKTWFTLKTYGTEKLGAIITRTCALAGYLEARILAEPRLELLAPVQLNIVCFRYRAADANEVNRDIVIDIQESGIAAPSTTVLDGQLAIRAAIVNHRTDICDIDALISKRCWNSGRSGRVPGDGVPACLKVERERRRWRCSAAVRRTNSSRFRAAANLLAGAARCDPAASSHRRPASWLPSAPGTDRRSGCCC
jgi:aromatic-L-amino-acid decarboxylase